MISSCLTPDSRPTPMTSVSTNASSVMVGPRMAMPRPMLSTTSSCQQQHQSDPVNKSSCTLLTMSTVLRLSVTISVWQSTNYCSHMMCDTWGRQTIIGWSFFTSFSWLPPCQFNKKINHFSITCPSSGTQCVSLEYTKPIQWLLLCLYKSFYAQLPAMGRHMFYI